jgi:ABC-type sugar transport system ATPase subunit
MNNVPPTINTLAIAILFADDTSIIISSKNLDDFCMLSNRVLSLMSKRFAANKVAQNLDKTNIIYINVPHCPLSTGCTDKYTEEKA